MESAQSLKLRLHSISSTRQITRSMQMIASTKVQKTLRRMQENAPFVEHFGEIVRNIMRFAPSARHMYAAPPDVGCSAIIAVSGNRGLCGSYNSNVCREAVTQIKRMNRDARCVTIGWKMRDHLRRRNFAVERAFDGASESPFYETARDAGGVALELYKNGAVDSVFIVYTRYESALSLVPRADRILPLSAPDEGERDPRGRQMCFEPGADGVLDYVAPFYLSARVYGAMLSAAACEQSARVVSMDAASKNCADIIERLSLQYNRLRQSGITQELNEIVSGAEALLTTEES
ncbi:MAG: ATP synthase F1 subunit gamma [Synergistaceae bacterium]|jgi:F-type H+-transporting ATPase subunit gamma|nr:ATP synthase F1 subunit gamma [Synergistaceae bacterium]